MKKMNKKITAARESVKLAIKKFLTPLEQSVVDFIERTYSQTGESVSRFKIRDHLYSILGEPQEELKTNPATGETYLSITTNEAINDILNKELPNLLKAKILAIGEKGHYIPYYEGYEEDLSKRQRKFKKKYPKIKDFEDFLENPPRKETKNTKTTAPELFARWISESEENFLNNEYYNEFIVDLQHDGVSEETIREIDQLYDKTKRHLN